ncbi:MAG: 5-oxoprolinase subunit PxpB [Clostridia bacterium]|nr:5-oxoprolinase subunit PxpB [Clostridia bacterium]MBQ9966129.1 5-oxoprolinase subunit PxpB [Clostridia bacterium]
MKGEIRFCGDRAVTVVFEQKISPEVNADVCGFTARFSELNMSGVIEIVPTYSAVTIHFDPMVLDAEVLVDSVEKILDGRGGEAQAEGETVVIPVVYGGEYGPDIDNVCQHTGLSREEVIARHSGREYLIYMLGFTPGFPYMGGMDETIATPRLKTPRTAIPAGSVGIAGAQTGVYPIQSPGGWQLIGRTPLKLFDMDRPDPFLLRAGQKVVFRPISEEEYERMVKE